jgi:uncharacterized membrane protein YcaP (DUF421 family)
MLKGANNMADWLQIALRTLLTIVVLFGLTRILGKRQITQLTFFEYITGIALGSLAAFIAVNPSGNWFLGFVALGVWVTVVVAVEILELKSKHFRDWTEGKGTVLIKDGKIMEENLKKVRYSSDDLLEQLRRKNAFAATDVEFAVLETTGDLSVLLRRENQPLTPKDLGVKVPNEQEPQSVIMDGNIMDEPLATIGLSRDWLNSELKKIGVTHENVYLGQVNSFGELFVDLYDDQIKVPEPQPRELLLALLKKCTADLELFCLATKDPTAKANYEQSLIKMKTMLSELTPFLQK